MDPKYYGLCAKAELHQKRFHTDLFILLCSHESEFNEFELRLKSFKNRFQLSTGLNIETLNTILSKTNHIRAAA